MEIASVVQVFNWSDKALFGLIRGQSRWQLKKHSRGGRGMWLSNRLRPKTLVTLDQEVTGGRLRSSLFPLTQQSAFMRDICAEGQSKLQIPIRACLHLSNHVCTHCVFSIQMVCKESKNLCINPCMTTAHFLKVSGGETSDVVPLPAGPLSFLIRDQRLDAHANQWLAELRTACETEKTPKEQSN